MRTVGAAAALAAGGADAATGCFGLFAGVDAGSGVESLRSFIGITVDFRRSSSASVASISLSIAATSSSGSETTLFLERNRFQRGISRGLVCLKNGKIFRGLVRFYFGWLHWFYFCGKALKLLQKIEYQAIDIVWPGRGRIRLVWLFWSKPAVDFGYGLPLYSS